jgi:hypothetical protein
MHELAEMKTSGYHRKEARKGRAEAFFERHRFQFFRLFEFPSLSKKEPLLESSR